MQNKKVIRFLKCLSKHELREFRKFIRSPFHNNRKDVVRFYDILKTYYPDFKIDASAQKTIFAKLYPGKKYLANSIVLLSSYLFNLGKEFLSISGLKEDQFFYKYHYLKNLDKHYANNLFEKEYKNISRNLKNEKLNDQKYFHSSLLEELNINFNLRRNRQYKTSGNTVHFGDLSVYSFIVRLVVTYFDMLSNKNSFNYEFSESAMELFIKNFNFEGFIKDLKTEEIKDYNYLVYYHYVFMCYYYPEVEDYYLKLKEYSFKDFDDLNEEEKSVRFLYLINYCIVQIESGNLKYLRETFNVYTEALEKRLHQFDSKDIGLMFFRNFVLVGLAAKEYDYIENFISEFGKELKEDYKDELLKLCYAMLHFERKQYTEALDYLGKMNNTYPVFRLGIKHLYIKIYYEINDYISLFSLIDAYRHYVKNDKTLPDRIRENHVNFLNYVSRLAKINSSDNNEDLFALKKEIKNNPNMDFRHKFWLVGRAEEIK